MSILELEPCLNLLDESHGVARTTLCLISQLTGEVVAFDVSEIMLFRDHLIWDFVDGLVLGPPVLRCCDGFLEVVRVFAESLLASCGIRTFTRLRRSTVTTLSQRNFSVAFVLIVFRVMLLKHAHVRLPSKQVLVIVYQTYV